MARDKIDQTARTAMHVATVVLSGLLLAACGAGNNVATTQPGPCAPDRSVFPANLDPVPYSNEIPPDNAVIDRDQSSARDYVSKFPDQYSGMFRLHNPERIVVAFTDDVDHHRAELSHLVSRADRLLVLSGCASEKQLSTMAKEIKSQVPVPDMMPESSVDAIGGFIQINLRADGEAFARTLHDRYGEWVSINVGAKHFPIGSVARIGARVARPVPFPTPPDKSILQTTLPASLRVDSVLDAAAVRSGSDITGTLKVTNVGADAIIVVRGALDGVIVEEGSTTVVGAGAGRLVVAMAPEHHLLQPGDTTELHFTAGTADIRDNGNFALPPGTYGLRVPLTVSNTSSNSAGEPVDNKTYWVPETRFSVTG